MSELGTALKQARQEKGMTLEDIESKTKIQKRYLQSIEEGEFDQLPGNFYTRAFIKNYAETVGLDPNVLLNEYGHEIPKSSQEPSQVILPSRTRQSAGLSFKSAKRRQTDSQFNSLLPKIIIIVVLLLILIGIWLLAQHFKSSDKSAVTNHTSPDVVYKKDENNSGKSAADEKKQKDQKAKSETKDNKKDQKSKKTRLMKSSTYQWISHKEIRHILLCQAPINLMLKYQPSLRNKRGSRQGTAAKAGKNLLMA